MINGPENIEGRKLVNGERYSLFMLQLSASERCLVFPRLLDCKTVVFFANASDGKYSNERSVASGKMARENGERRFLALHTRGSRLRRFASSEKIRKRLFCSLRDYSLLHVMKTFHTPAFDQLLQLDF